jgi:multidrug efflux system outer membrane protein
MSRSSATFLFFAALFSALYLSACADFRGMPSLDVKLPTGFTQTQTLDKNTTTAKLQQDWWKTANDQTLETIIERIQQQNLSLEQARFRLIAARENTRATDFLPHMTANLDAQYNRLIKGDNSINGFSSLSSQGQEKNTGYYNAKIDASWEVPLYGQFGNAKDFETAGIDYAAADLEAIRASVISEAIRIYAEMRRWQNALEQFQIIEDSYKKIAEYQASKYKAGLTTTTVVSESGRDALLAKNNTASAKSQIIASQYQLATLLGMMSPNQDWQEIVKIPNFDLPPLDDTPLDVLRNRPDIRRSEAAVFQAAAEFELSKNDMYPKITLNGNLAQLGNITGNPLTGKTVQLTGIPAISLPLFDWGKRLSNTKQRDAKLSEAAAFYRETVITAINEVEELISKYATALENEKNMRKGAEFAFAVSNNASLLFKKGISDGIDKERSAVLAAEAAIRSLEAQADSITQLSVLTKAIGGTGVYSD